MTEKQRVDETHKRSILKGITSRIIEIAVDTALFTVVGLDVHVSFGVSIVVECLCFITHYINERIWNKIHWGRRVLGRRVK